MMKCAIVITELVWDFLINFPKKYVATSEDVLVILYNFFTCFNNIGCDWLFNCNECCPWDWCSDFACCCTSDYEYDTCIDFGGNSPDQDDINEADISSVACNRAADCYNFCCGRNDVYPIYTKYNYNIKRPVPLIKNESCLATKKSKRYRKPVRKNKDSQMKISLNTKVNFIDIVLFCTWLVESTFSTVKSWKTCIISLVKRTIHANNFASVDKKIIQLLEVYSFFDVLYFCVHTFALSSNCL